LRDIVWQEFEGNETAKVGVLGLVDDTHPTATELPDDSVVRDSSVDHVPDGVAAND
jgi:hypothetical protein